MTSGIERVLLTGAGGFVGGHLARYLRGRGVEVVALAYMPAAGGPRPAVPRHAYDGTLDSVRRALEAARPQVVVHLASLFLAEHRPEQLDALVDGNLRFGLHLLEAMSLEGVLRFVNAGTSWQHFGGAAYDPVNLYAATKQAFEDLVEHYANARGVGAVTLKLFDTYGPDDRRGKIVSLLIQALRDGRTLELSPGEQRLDLIHVEDVCAGFEAAALRLFRPARAGHERFGLGSGQTVSLRELARLLEDLSGQSLDVRWGERTYRAREVMLPPQGLPRLPGWRARVPLHSGLKGLL
jgi:nucleoside-diphosphate-sugar epimerase